MKRIPDVKVMALRLDAMDIEGDAMLVEELVVRMTADGWAFMSLATPTRATALVAFTRPHRKD